MLDLRRTDPEREGAERAVGRGMAVAADDRHSRLRTSLFRADDMDDAAPPIAHRERLDPETTRVGGQRFTLGPRLRLEGRGVGKGVVRTCRYGWDPYD